MPIKNVDLNSGMVLYKKTASEKAAFEAKVLSERNAVENDSLREELERVKKELAKVKRVANKD